MTKQTKPALYILVTARSLDWTFCRPVFASSPRLQRREIGISRKDKSEKPQYNNNTHEEEMKCRSTIRECREDR